MSNARAGTKMGHPTPGVGIIAFVSQCWGPRDGNDPKGSSLDFVTTSRLHPGPRFRELANHISLPTACSGSRDQQRAEGLWGLGSVLMDLTSHLLLSPFFHDNFQVPWVLATATTKNDDTPCRPTAPRRRSAQASTRVKR